MVIAVGKTYFTKSLVGKVEIVTKHDRCHFFWGRLIYPRHQMDGKELPFEGGSGRYIGCSRWRVPDLDYEAK